MKNYLFSGLLISALVGFCADYAGAAPNTTVTLKNFKFVPRTLTVAPGTTVTWTVHQSGVTHDIDSDDGKSFSSPDLVDGNTFKHKFRKAGKFPYHCSFHGDKQGAGMAGIIVVKAPTK